MAEKILINDSTNEQQLLLTSPDDKGKKWWFFTLNEKVTWCNLVTFCFMTFLQAAYVGFLLRFIPQLFVQLFDLS
jgi:hypothetical protein